MNEIEKAIADIKSGYNTDFTVQMSLQALQAQAERDKMRCENCKHWANGLAVKRPCHKTNAYPMIASDFCSYFEPKENENG